MILTFLKELLAFFLNLSYDREPSFLYIKENLLYVTIARGIIRIYGLLGENKGCIEHSSLGLLARISLEGGIIYVCDMGNHQIVGFDKTNYSIIQRWGRKGTANGEFYCPFAIESYENILYIGDRCSVQLFDLDGQFLQRIGGKRLGQEDGKFDGVRGIVIIKNYLYISDYWSDRIQIFLRA